jgi:uncharacterized delta-60 repeat protein
MWFLASHKMRRGPASRSLRGSFRPQLEALEDRRLLSTGALDTSFGGPPGSNSPAGTVLGPSPIYGEAMVVYPSTDAMNHDKVLVGGEFSYTVTTKQGTTYTSNFALARYNANGSLDTSFGTQGTGTVSTVIGDSSQIVGLALQSDGKIVAVGHEFDGSNFNFVIARYTADGRLDSSANDPTSAFGTNGSGFVVTHVVVPGASTGGINQSPAAVVVQGDVSNEKIYVGGWAAFTSGKGKNTTTSWASVVVCYTANGSLAAFGSGGMAVTSFASGFNAYAMAVQPSDGKILLAGSAPSSSSSAMTVVRYTAAGVLDSKFGPSTSPGIVTLTPPNSGSSDQAEASGIFVQSSGAIVLSGDGYYPSAEKQVLVRVSPSGTLDTTFGTSGFAVNPYILNGHNIVQAANGDLLTAGTVGNKTYDASDDFGVAAYLPNGAPDTTFGKSSTPGTNTVDITGGEDMGRAIALQSDGKIVVGGFYYNAATSTPSVALARFLPPATKITSFTANPNSVTAGTLVTLTVSGILNSNPTSTITGIDFYLDSVGGTPLTVALLSNSNGTWSYSFDTTSLTSGTHTLYAEAVDSNGIFSDPVAVSIQVS